MSLKYHKHYKRLISVKGNSHTEKRTTEQVIRLKINFFWCVSNTALEKKYVELCPPLNIFAREWHWLVSIEKNKTKKVLFDSSKPYPTEAFAYEHTHTHTQQTHLDPWGQHKCLRVRKIKLFHFVSMSHCVCADTTKTPCKHKKTLWRAAKLHGMLLKEGG